MHNVSATILTDYVMLWSMIDVMHLDLSDPADDDIVWTRTTDESTRPSPLTACSSLEACCPLRGDNLAGLVTITLQTLRLADGAKPGLDSRPITCKGMAKSIFLPSLLPQPRDH
jgi:hypothetical protein